MAIVDSPLLSLGAKKTLGKTLTFLRVKGQNVVRQRVIPANPRTAAQQAQRAIVSAAVLEWQTAGLSADDKAAFNRWASAAFRTQSGYNRFISERAAWLKAGSDTSLLKNVTDEGPGDPGEETIQMELEALNTGVCYWGVSKSSQPESKSINDLGGGSFDVILDGLVEGVTGAAG